MNYNELTQLIDRLDKSSIAYLKYQQGNDLIELSKEVPQSTVVPPVIPATPLAPVATVPTEPVAPVTEPVFETKEEPATEQKEGKEIVAPMIGVAYLQESPDAEPYVQVGDYVNQGDVVCIIEAMKLMNEIQSPISGTITEILVENEAVVEYNQPLFRVN